MGRSLTGSRCRDCGTVAFPPARGCQSCGRQSMTALELSRPRHGVGLHGAAVRAQVAAVRRPGGRVRARSRSATSSCRKESRWRPSWTAPTSPSSTATPQVTLVAVEPVPRFATDEALVAVLHVRSRPMSTGVSIVGAGLSKFGRQPGRHRPRARARGDRRGAASTPGSPGPMSRSRSAAATARVWPTPSSPSSA